MPDQVHTHVEEVRQQTQQNEESAIQVLSGRNFPQNQNGELLNGQNQDQAQIIYANHDANDVSVAAIHNQDDDQHSAEIIRNDEDEDLPRNQQQDGD